MALDCLPCGCKIIGRIVALGSEAKGLQIVLVSAGQLKVANRVMNVLASTLYGQKCCNNRRACWSDKVRAGWQWAIPLPEDLKVQVLYFVAELPCLIHSSDSGNPSCGCDWHWRFRSFKLLKGWGCEITAFSSNPQKSLKQWGPTMSSIAAIPKSSKR